MALPGGRGDSQWARQCTFLCHVCSKKSTNCKKQMKGIAISGKVAMLSGRCGLSKTDNQVGPGQSCGEQNETLEALGCVGHVAT